MTPIMTLIPSFCAAACIIMYNFLHIMLEKENFYRVVRELLSKKRIIIVSLICISKERIPSTPPTATACIF